jgi:hypothetical protein
MHFFVSEIKCTIHTMKLRKMDKAEMPDPKLIFVTSPLEAIQKDEGTSKKTTTWDILGFIGSSSNKDRKTDSAPSLSSSNYPSTSAVKDTMRPSWGSETVHFCIRTHLNSGEAINLSTALLHFSLRDNKTTSLIGSYALNLSRLILASRGNPRGRQQDQRPATPRGPRPGRAVAVGGAESGGYNFSPPSAAFLSAGTAGTSNEHVKRAALALTGKADPNSLLFGASGRAAMLARRGSLRTLDVGPSRSLLSSMVSDPTRAGQSVDAQLKQMNLKSLKLDEPLYGGGLEVGRIKCSIDVWWSSEGI